MHSEFPTSKTHEQLRKLFGPAVKFTMCYGPKGTTVAVCVNDATPGLMDTLAIARAVA